MGKVTPFVGVWIETRRWILQTLVTCVTPFVGVWIETVSGNVPSTTMSKSHPSWVCGLKLGYLLRVLMPLASHTLRGCVD